MSPTSSALISEPRANRRAKRNRRSALALVALLALTVGVSEWLKPAHTPSDEAANSGWRSQARVDTKEHRSTWFCAAGTSQPGGRADETLTVANIGGARAFTAEIKVSVMTGVGVSPSKFDFKLAPVGNANSAATGLPSIRSIPVSTILASPDPGIVIEATGAPVVVTHSVAGAGDVATSPCARGGSPEWYFGGGTTVLGAEQWLTLFNPFPGDAVVDLTFFTGIGVEAPSDAQGVVVAGTSRLSIPVHDLVPRRDAVATRVTTRRGRVIAEQVQSLDGRDGRRGITLTAGVPRLAKQWWFSGATAANGRITTASILNPGARRVSIRLDTALVGAVTLGPIDIEVPPRSVVVTNVSSRVPAGTPFAWRLSLRDSERKSGESSAGIAVEALVSQSGISSGLAADSGTPFASSSWYLMAPDLLGGDMREVAIFNTSNKQVKWSLRTLDRGAESGLRRGRLAPWALSRQSVAVSGVLKVDADGLVAVSHASQGLRGTILSAGIPLCPSPLTGGATGVSPC